MDFIRNLDKGGFSEGEFKDVTACLDNLFSTIAGTLGGDRDFGIAIDEIVGAPNEVAKNLLTIEITEKVDRYEPRVEVSEIVFIEEEQVLKPVIFLKKREDKDED